MRHRAPSKGGSDEEDMQARSPLSKDAIGQDALEMQFPGTVADHEHAGAGPQRKSGNAVSRACRCLYTLMGRRAAENGDRGLRDFFQVMLGEAALHELTRDPQAWQGDGRHEGSLCLEELTDKTLAQLLSRAVAEAAGARSIEGEDAVEGGAESAKRGSGKGLVAALRPYLEDLLTRRRGFRSVADLLALGAETEDAPRVLTEVTAKDVFVALLLASPLRQRASLAAAYASLRAPVPIVFSVPPPLSDGPLTTACFFNVLQELACVPCTGRELIVSLGTRRTVGCGKTQLLGALALTPEQEEELDVRPSGPLHSSSCDVSCADSRRWIVDAHGHWAGVDDTFRAAILALTCWGRAVWLVHCSSADLHGKTGVPIGELADLLASLSSLASLPSDASGTETAPRGSAGIILLVRDAVDALPGLPDVADQIRQEHGVPCLGILPIEDCRAFRSAARKTAALERMREGVKERLVTAWAGGTASTPGLEELNRIHALISDGVLGRLRIAGNTHSSRFGALEGRWSLTESEAPGTAAARCSVGPRFLELLNEANATGGAVSALFPLSVVHRRLTSLRRADAGAGPSDATQGGNSQLEQVRLEEDRARAREAEIRKLEEELVSVAFSPAIAFFQKSVTTGGMSSLSEMRLHLEDWKEPLVLPLLARQRELFDSSSAEGSGGCDDKYAAELHLVSRQLDALDFSMDSFWAELELISDRQKKQSSKNAQPSVDVQAAQGCMRALVDDGCPFQVLHGQPLSMAGDFLRGVLEAIGAPQSDAHGIYVVSVIGAQSSAKSTLLNFLFGCGFAVRAGRCTRGLYASYFRPAGSTPMLVLDSEGLLSLGSEGAVFDGQIALMCMSCSHLVLVNHKGELSRQLQDLLEVCLFAMRHLRLTRLQPRLVFVLRDQHDRSSTVHEGMLKQMRSHLEEAAQTLGTPLEDLIRLDGTAVFMLPSAVTSELRQGQEVCWTSELFSREVLRLRGEVFRWLRLDAESRANGGPAEFNSLTNWYDYASTVWETLVQFGGRLLHYKTIHDIELRRELADVAKVAVQDALEGSAASQGADGSMGFHARAQQMVDSFVSRVQASPTKLDLDTTDMELGRALACLRDECIGQLEELFQERTSDPRFSATAKEQARKQIRTPIEWAFENHLYTWKLHLKRATDEQAMHALWVHFTGVLNRHLANSGHRSTVSEAESRSIFESEWRAYETQYLDRHRMLTKDWQTLAHEVTLLFNHAMMKLQHEQGPLALLKEVGPQLVSLSPERRRESGMPTITDQTDEEWEEQYFHVGWWATVRKRGMALLQNNGVDAVQNLIPRMRQAIQQGLQTFQIQVIERAALDEATAAEGLRHISGVVLQDIESRLLNDWSVGTLKRPQMLHALHVALRLCCIEALVAVEANKQEQAMKDLHSQKAHVEEHFLLIIQTNKGDVERAANFAKMYHRALTSWIDHEVTCLAAEVRSQVLQEMPDPQKSSERAFQLSFGAHNWQDVLEYVLDMNAYLEKVFITLFHQRKRSYVDSARSRLEKRIGVTYRLLQGVAQEWARKEAASSPEDAPKVDVTTGPTAVTLQRSVRELKEYITKHGESVPDNAEKADGHRQLAERLPATADFPINDPQLFAEAFQTRIGDFIDSPEMSKRVAAQLDKALQEQSVRAWGLIRGCQECCPLCGSKCDVVGEHSRHHCAHHLFPAFHGWMDRNTGLPSFNHCQGCSTREGTYECKDGVWRSLEDYLNADHPSWLPFVCDQAASDRDVQLLRAAWVNCREPFLEYFSPMADHCPEEWREVHEDGKSLTVADLQVAKDTIRKLRNHTWTPLED